MVQGWTGIPKNLCVRFVFNRRCHFNIIGLIFFLFRGLTLSIIVVIPTAASIEYAFVLKELPASVHFVIGFPVFH